MASGKFLNQLNALAYASIDSTNDLLGLYDASATEHKYIALLEFIKRSLGSGDISWMTALSGITALDRAADKFMIYDADANAIKSLLVGKITDYLYTLGSDKVRNPLFFSADPTGVSSAKTPFINLLAALADGDLVIVPPGTYTLTAFGYQAFTENRITFLGIGQPIIDMGGGGLVLSGNQSDIRFEGIHFTNFGECLAPNSIDDLKTNFSVSRCKFYDATSSGSHHAVKMWCKVKGATVTDNVIQNIGSSTGSCYGIVLGEKGDNATRTPDPSQEFDYGFDGSTWDSAEGNLVVTGNRINKLRGNSDEVTGILVDGWRSNVAKNIIGDIVSSSTGGVGIYTRGFDANVEVNQVADCSHAHVVSKGAPTDPSVGNTGHVLISGNTFRTSTQFCSYDSIELTVGNAKIVNNKFIRIQMSQTSGAIVYDTGQSNIEVSDNEFYKCKGRHIHFTHGSNKFADRNRVIDPIGNGSSDFEIFTSAPNLDSALNIGFRDNEFIFTSAYAGTGTIYCVRAYPTAGQTLLGLEIRNNKVRGLADFRAAKATLGLYVVQALVRTDGQEHWSIEDNYADEWRPSYTIINDVQLSGATVWPTGLTRRARYNKPVVLTADVTATYYHSGAEYNNSGQAVARDIALPAARPGLEFTAERIAAYSIYFSPNGTDVAGDGGPGKRLQLTKSGRVKLRCRDSGIWQIVEMTCWDDPGSSGTPVPGITWET